MKTLLFTATLLFACQDAEQAGQQRPRVEHTAKKIWIQGPAGKLFADCGGDASASTNAMPVVIVHSLAGNTTQWQVQLTHLRANRLAVAFDMRGHGQSDPARDHDYSLVAMARDLAAVVDSLGLQKFVLLGHSLGGGVIATYASQYPEKAAGLLFVDPIGDARQFPRAEVDNLLAALRSEKYAETIEAHWRSILINADSAVAAAVMTGLRQTPRETTSGAIADIFSFDPAAVLRSYQGPMQTIVSGLPDDASALHHAVLGLPRVTMSGTSHWLQMDQPEEFNRLMDEFLQKVDSL